MPVLGLTGPIASGKSTASDFFVGHGAHVIDADLVVHQLQSSGTPQTTAIQNLISAPVLTEAGAIDRTLLGQALEQTPALFPRLEDILFPAVFEHMQHMLAQVDAPLIVLSAPLLFQAGIDQLCDSVALCHCSASTRVKRALARSGMTQARYELYQQRQLSDQELYDLAEHHIPTEDKAVTSLAITALWHQLVGN